MQLTEQSSVWLRSSSQSSPPKTHSKFLSPDAHISSSTSPTTTLPTSPLPCIVIFFPPSYFSTMPSSFSSSTSSLPYSSSQPCTIRRRLHWQPTYFRNTSRTSSPSLHHMKRTSMSTMPFLLCPPPCSPPRFLR